MENSHMNTIHRWDLTPMDHKELKVITMVSNPIRYKTRYNLYRKFAKHMADSGVDLITCEVQLGDRPFEVTEAGNPNHVQLRTSSEIWIKENALNIAARRLYELWPDWKYMAWIDADVQFAREDWAAEAVSMLSRFRIIQLWSSAIDLDFNMNPLFTTRSFCWCHREFLRHPEKVGFLNDQGVWEKNQGMSDWRGYAAQAKPFWHSGYAWAMRRETYEGLGGPYDGGLFEVSVIGSGDHHMALAWIGEVQRSMPQKCGKRYRELVMEYQARSDKVVQKDIGYIDGAIFHYFHGAKASRGYRTRWNILGENQYDPTYDLTRDANGLFKLTDRNLKFRDDLRCYFESRNEDNPNN